MGRGNILCILDLVDDFRTDDPCHDVDSKLQRKVVCGIVIDWLFWWLQLYLNQILLQTYFPTDPEFLGTLS